MEKHIADKSRKGPIRVPVVFAVVRLLRLLPAEGLHHQLPKLLGVVCNSLKERDQVIRDTARSTLTQVLFFFFFINL